MSVHEQERPREHLGRRAASGFLWLAAQKWVARLSGFATLVVLTHQISPRDFGVVAAAMTVIPTVYLLADLGFSTYLLQADAPDQVSLSTAFWTSVAAALALSAGLLAIAPLLATAFQIAELSAVLRMLALAVLPTVVAGVPLSLLRRNMAFRSVALQSLVAALLGQVVAVVLALRGGGVWALVSQVIVMQWAVAVLAWWRAGWLPSLLLSWPRLRQMAVFGVRVSTVDVVGTLRILAESWIVTVALGPAGLGLLNIGQRLVLVAQDLVAASMVPVSTVAFARVRDSADRLRASYLKALGVVYAVVSPVMILLVVTAPELIPLLFGARWSASVPPAQALAVAGIITLGAMLDHGLFYGLGRPGSWLSYAVVVDGATVATTAFAVRWGLVGVAAGFVVVAFLATVARWVLVSRMLGWDLRDVARPFFGVAPATAVSMVIGVIALKTVPGQPLGAILVAGVLTVVAHLFLLRLAAPGIISDALGILPLPDEFAARTARLFGLPRAHRTTRRRGAP
ncbi:MAG TPA: lipopolysaccharide biosynthesis protein [Nocardioidaceae bacterium]|nr:lipopolysaccharide biosynthesis protein [Nocardioidaceae bacterium]